MTNISFYHKQKYNHIQWADAIRDLCSGNYKLIIESKRRWIQADQMVALNPWVIYFIILTKLFQIFPYFDLFGYSTLLRKFFEIHDQD